MHGNVSLSFARTIGNKFFSLKVKSFPLHGHPKAERLYAWMHDTDDPAKPKRHITILHIPPITSAIEAVRAVIIQEYREMSIYILKREEGKL